MDAYSHGITCGLIRELVTILAEEAPETPLSEQEHLFERLLDLERRAREEGADAVALTAIASARRMAGVAATVIVPPHIHGH